MKEKTMKKEKKEKKIYFSKEIDDIINSFSTTITFIIIGILLQFFPTFFGLPIVTTIIEWFFIIVGSLAFCGTVNKSQDIIIGFDKFIWGIVFLCAWFALYTIYNNNLIVNISSFILLILGIYAIILSIIQMIYSFVSYRKKIKKNEEQKENKSDIILLLTKLFGMLLVAAQVFKAVIELKGS